tara:strand:+ start:160 stop:768 length:609 start_codon:yes stop_codon:yes gene_type:complete
MKKSYKILVGLSLAATIVWEAGVQIKASQLEDKLKEIPAYTEATQLDYAESELEKAAANLEYRPIPTTTERSGILPRQQKAKQKIDESLKYTEKYEEINENLSAISTTIDTTKGYSNFASIQKEVKEIREQIIEKKERLTKEIPEELLSKKKVYTLYRLLPFLIIAGVAATKTITQGLKSKGFHPDNRDYNNFYRGPPGSRM